MLTIRKDKKTHELEPDFHRKLSSMMKACNFMPNEDLGYFTTEDLMTFVSENPSKVQILEY